MGVRTWTEEQIAVLRWWRSEGLTERIIAKRIGKSPQALWDKARRIGLPRKPISRPWSKSEIASLRQWWSAGIACRAIAERLDRSRSAVIGKAYRLELPRHLNDSAHRDRVTGQYSRTESMVLIQKTEET